MKLLVDINVALDVILERKPWVAEAALLFTAIQQGKAEGYLAAHTIPTVYHVVRENRKDKAAANDAVRKLLRIFEVVAVENADFEEALSLEFSDFEDAAQAACAIKMDADYIVTRNTKDFKKAPIPAEPPGAVLAALERAESSEEMTADELGGEEG